MGRSLVPVERTDWNALRSPRRRPAALPTAAKWPPFGASLKYVEVGVDLLGPDARGLEQLLPKTVNPVDTLISGASVEARMAELGFDPAVATGDEAATVAFAHCPFTELAEERPHLICNLHRGLVEGLVAGWAVAPSKVSGPSSTGIRARWIASTRRR